MRGTAPFGYRHQDGELVEDDGEQAIIKTIRTYRKGTNPLSFGKMAATLNREGTLNRGKFWNPTTLWYIFNRETGTTPKSRTK